MQAWLGIIGTICGVIAGWALTETTKAISEKRKAVRDLKTAAFVCLDRLLKIKNATSRGDQKQVDGEIYYLGSDLDRYRDRIAASPKMRKTHWEMYRRIIPILLEHDLSVLDQAIKELESVSGATD